MSFTAKTPPNPFQTIPYGKMLGDELLAQMRIDSADAERQWGLGVARVEALDYEGHTVTLRVLMGATNNERRAPVMMSYPAAGARHILGAMPEEGDLAVVGWMPQESLKPSTARAPVILGWLIPGIVSGRKWMTTAEFGDSELDSGNARQRDVLGAAHPRVRHKLRHMQPGNIIGSSAQGSDLVLDESAHLANRRGNEFTLRDQDQAAVTRALQRFDALAGVRAYHGMVQRDAMFLAPPMVGDGKDWAGPLQKIDGRPVPSNLMPDDPNAPEGFLTPARVFGKRPGEDGNLIAGLYPFEEHLDPYMFLQRGGFLNETGFVVNPQPSSDAIYGGKGMYRVAAQKDVNAVLSPDTPTLTEYRVEVTHTSDGRLPVSEQTDGFDAERLPSTDPETSGSGPNRPFIEWVLGSVVGNDPYTGKGRTGYGVPLVPRVFTSGGVPMPRLEPVPLTTSGKSDASPVPLGEHAATLFKIDPIDGSPSTWWSVNKRGQLKGSIAGPRNEPSAELFLNGGLSLGMGGKLELFMQGGVSLGTKSKQSLHLQSDEGPVSIYGGGPVGGAEKASQQNGAGKLSDLPSVDIHARTNARIRAGRKVLLKGQVIETQSKRVVMSNLSNLDVDAADGRVSIKCETFDIISSAKKTEQFSGPKNFIPTAGALHERTYTPSTPGLVCEAVNYTWGDREETFKLGNHTTEILIGNATYRTRAGSVKLQGVLSTLELSATGIEASAPVGTISLRANAGTARMSALAGVTIEATAGMATVRGGLGVVLRGPLYGPDQGPILCAGSLEPFTGLPFATWNMGAKGHIISG